MSLLDFSNLEPKRSGEKKTLSIILGIGALVGVIAIGSTLAASINLNSNNPVEFGQGVTQTTACDDEVTITPYSTFVNDYENAEFRLTSFSVTGISDSCFGKVFIIKAYSNSDDSPLDLYFPDGAADAFSEVQVLDTNGSFSLVNSGLNSEYIEDVSTGFKVTLVAIGLEAGAVLASAQDVDRITIESKDSEPVYAVGETGPGGGVIFYFSADGFNCGANFSSTGSPTSGKCHYLEVSPGGWNNNGLDPQKSWAVDSKIFDDVIEVNNDNSVPFNDAMGIGLGLKNSEAIVSQGNDETTAAGKARAYSGGSKNDWYLPTTAELNLLCQWSHGVTSSVTTACSGGTNNSSTYGAGSARFNDGVYWSSSEFDANWAWYQSFIDGSQQKLLKNNIPDVRPIRAF